MGPIRSASGGAVIDWESQLLDLNVTINGSSAGEYDTVAAQN